MSTACSAISVLPEPVGTLTITVSPRWRALIASSWNLSRMKPLYFSRLLLLYLLIELPGIAVKRGARITD
ncbi:MAG: hypothetical protein ACFFD4_17035 [Candidatus Odinarchaeota archaeon]